MIRTAVRAGLVGAAVVAACWTSGPAFAAPPVPEPGEVPQAPSVNAPKSVTVEMGSEAWYQLTRVNTCSSPAGCLPAEVPALPELPVALPVDPTVYPPDTLHVGWAGGLELARTYLKIDTSAVPQGSTLVSGTLELPLITDPASGTLLADSAGVKACLVVEEFDDGVAGSLGSAPDIDCSVSSPLTLEGASFTVDLQPFIEAWAGGTVDHGIAITPFTSSSVQSAWAIALPGRNASGLPHIGATLDYVAGQAAVPPVVVAPAAPVALPPAVVNPVQLPGTVNQPAQAPPAAVPVQQDVVKAAGATPFGWFVLAAGLVALIALVWVVRDQEPNALIG